MDARSRRLEVSERGADALKSGRNRWRKTQSANPVATSKTRFQRQPARAHNVIKKESTTAPQPVANAKRAGRGNEAALLRVRSGEAISGSNSKLPIQTAPALSATSAKLCLLGSRKGDALEA